MYDQRIYYSESDDSKDGNGWNVVDDLEIGGIAARFSTAPIAVAFCKARGFRFFVDHDDPPGLVWKEDEGWIDA